MFTNKTVLGIRVSVRHLVTAAGIPLMLTVHTIADLPIYWGRYAHSTYIVNLGTYMVNLPMYCSFSEPSSSICMMTVTPMPWAICRCLGFVWPAMAHSAHAPCSFTSMENICKDDSGLQSRYNREIISYRYKGKRAGSREGVGEREGHGLARMTSIKGRQLRLSACELTRSEERRGGKECRSRWSPNH